MNFVSWLVAWNKPLWEYLHFWNYSKHYRSGLPAFLPNLVYQHATFLILAYFPEDSKFKLSLYQNPFRKLCTFECLGQLSNFIWFLGKRTRKVTCPRFPQLVFGCVPFILLLGNLAYLLYCHSTQNSPFTFLLLWFHLQLSFQ